MSILKGLFGKKKELSGQEIGSLFKTISVDREAVIVTTSSFKFISDIIEYGSGIFHVKNTLSRDEVLYQLKGQELRIQVPYELTLYGGDSRLMGLGMVQGIHTLKLMIPTELSQEESRGAYRICTFPETPSVTFSCDQTDIIKARLIDISMTGAGIRLDPRWMVGKVKLSVRNSIILDVRLTGDLRVSTTATIRYTKNNKLGVQFQDMRRSTREKLFKFVVQQRREEYRALIRKREKIHDLATKSRAQSPEQVPEKTDEKPIGKPTALLVGKNRQHIDLLTSALNRKFDLIYATPTVTDIRNQCDLQPNLCLLELHMDDSEQVSQVKKLGSILPPACVLMFFGENFTLSFRQRFLGNVYAPEVLVDLQSPKKLMIFKNIQHYYEQKAPKMRT